MNHPALLSTDPVVTLRGEEAVAFLERWQRTPVFSRLVDGAEYFPEIQRPDGDFVVIGVLEANGGRSWWLLPESAALFHEHNVSVNPKMLGKS